MIMEDTLKVPHVEMAKRAFVLEPLAEIAPYAYHPGYHKTIIELLEILQNKKIKLQYKKNYIQGSGK